MARIERAKYLIIGNSAGGIGAAEAIREIDKEGTLTIISAEPYPAYSRPLISEYLAKKYPLDRMLFRPPNFYQRGGIQVILGKRVEQLDTEAHTLKLDDGREIAWEKLLLATGAQPIVPQIAGINRGGVFTFTTLDDAQKIDQFLSKFSKRTARAIVIGGGLIGVSAAEALVTRGIKVTVVEMKERLLNTILDEEVSALEEAALKRAGVGIITGHTVAEISSYSGNYATGATLDNGQPVPCELVIVAIGVRPRTELASGTGIKANRGILVDRGMATSSPDVYACGDVAEAYDSVYGENRLTPIWPNAYLGGRIAGLNMAGIATGCPAGTTMNSLKYFGLDIVSAGIVNPPGDSYEVLRSKCDHIYRKIVLKNGVAVGMVFVGKIEKSGVVFDLIKRKLKVDGFKKALVAEDFGLISLPEEIWRSELEVPISRVSTPTHFERPQKMAVGE